MFKKIVFIATLLGAALPGVIFAKSQPTTVRLLCVAPDIPPKAIRQPNGFFLPVSFDFDERPPASVSMKQPGDTYVAIPFRSNAISPPRVLDADKKGPVASGFYFQGPEAIDALALLDAAEKGGGAPKPDSDKTKPKPAVWHLLAESPKHDGKDHLICLFNPNPKAKWYPPKSMDVDISTAAFPRDRVLVVNMSGKVAYVQFGEGTKPVTLQPGTSVTMPVPKVPANTEVALKVAALIPPSSVRVVFNRAHPVPSDKRVVIALYEAAPRAVTPVEVRRFFIENPEPAVTPFATH